MNVVFQCRFRKADSTLYYKTANTADNKNQLFFLVLLQKIPCSRVCTFDRELFTRARVGVTQKTEWINFFIL